MAELSPAPDPLPGPPPRSLISSPSGISPLQTSIYNYVISTGVLALLAVYVPLHALLRSPRVRAAYRAVAIYFALLSSAACFAGAILGGKLWQTLPTGVFMLFLGAAVGLRVAGGWHALRQRARAPKRVKAAVVDDRHWREDMSREEWSFFANRSGMSAAGLMLGAESDRDAVAVGLLRGRIWNDEIGRRGIGSEAVGAIDRHEPVGLVFLGLVKYRRKWMQPLVEALRASSTRRRVLAVVHHAGIVVWLAGMVCGSIAKTGWWPGEMIVEAAGEEPVYQGSKRLRVGGIWMQTILLLIAVFALPYTRGVVRLGASVPGRLSVLWAQALVSFAIGFASVLYAREGKVVGTSIAYAMTLSLAALVATAWSILSVWAYLVGVTRLLRGADEVDGRESGIREDESGHLVGAFGRRRAYLACLLTRPRNGYAGQAPVARWGDCGFGASAANGLEVILEKDEVTASSEDPESSFHISGLEDLPINEEWNILESAAKSRRTFGI